jgi:hypothetical protein
MTYTLKMINAVRFFFSLKQLFRILLEDMHLDIHEGMWFEHGGTPANVSHPVHNWFSHHFRCLDWVWAG